MHRVEHFVKTSRFEVRNLENERVSTFHFEFECDKAIIAPIRFLFKRKVSIYKPKGGWMINLPLCIYLVIFLSNFRASKSGSGLKSDGNLAGFGDSPMVKFVAIDGVSLAISDSAPDSLELDNGKVGFRKLRTRDSLEELWAIQVINPSEELTSRKLELMMHGLLIKIKAN